MLTDLLTTLLGLAFLIGGGEALVRGASSLATRVGVSTLAIGLTVVAFGTSAPELAVNLAAVSHGANGLPFGNIFGSNLANIGLILAVAALIRPLDVQSVVFQREVPMMLLATAMASLLALDSFFGTGPNAFTGSDGFVLLLLFSVFFYYTGRDMIRDRARRTGEVRNLTSDPVGQSSDTLPAVPLSIFLTVMGIAGLVAGGTLTVNGAEGIARALGMSETLIGLTLVAFGTSLPELVASVIACLRNQTDLAVGNVVGSNIFNLLGVLGVTSTVAPVTVPANGLSDLVAVSSLSLILWVLTISDRGRVIRSEGALLLVLYFGYLIYRVLSPGG